MSRKEVRGLGQEDSPGGLGSAPQPGFLSHPLGGGGGVAWSIFVTLIPELDPNIVTSLSSENLAKFSFYSLDTAQCWPMKC